MKSLIAMLLSFPFLVIGQTTKGKIIDVQGNPIEFAHIFIKHSDSDSGTLSNSEGAFMFSEKIGKKDTLIISHLGFETTEIFNIRAGVSEFVLKENSESLDAVHVTALTSRETILKALAKIPLNYYDDRQQEGFFREQLYQNDTLSIVSEALIKFDFPSEITKPMLFIDKKKSVKFHGNPITMINGPIVLLERNEIYKKYSIFSKVILKNANFKLKSIEKLGIHNVYKIGFEHLGHQKNTIKGEVWIDLNDFGIHFLEMEVLAKRSVTKVKIYYKKSNKKYFTNAYKLEKSTKIKSGFLKGKIEYINTKNSKLSKSFKANNAKRFKNSDSLEEFDNHYDISFWDGYNHLLADSILVENIKNHKQLKTPKRKKRKKEKLSLYEPQIDMVISNQAFKDINSLNYNVNSFSRLSNYYLSKHIKNGLLLSGIQTLYSGFVITPFQTAEAERRLLTSENIDSKPIYTNLNAYGKPYTRGITTEALSNLKLNNPLTFNRILVVGHESNYKSIKTIEEQILKIPFLNQKETKEQFISNYYMEYFLRRTKLVIPFFLTKLQPNNLNDNELNLPIATNNLRSYVYYLFNPIAALNRNIRYEDLAGTELQYLKRFKLKSALNLIPLFTNLLPSISLKNDYFLNISGGYIPTYFGDQFEEIFFIRKNNILFQINAKQFIAKDLLGFGLGMKFHQNQFFKHLSFITSIDYWQQPTSFLNTNLQSGLALDQSFIWKFKSHTFWLGFIFKTKGFIDSSNSINEEQKLRIGFNIKL